MRATIRVEIDEDQVIDMERHNSPVSATLLEDGPITYARVVKVECEGSKWWVVDKVESHSSRLTSSPCSHCGSTRLAFTEPRDEEDVRNLFRFFAELMPVDNVDDIISYYKDEDEVCTSCVDHVIHTLLTAITVLERIGIQIDKMIREVTSESRKV